MVNVDTELGGTELKTVEAAIIDEILPLIKQLISFLGNIFKYLQNVATHVQQGSSSFN